jgi:hypothetical protein
MGRTGRRFLRTGDGVVPRVALECRLDGTLERRLTLLVAAGGSFHVLDDGHIRAVVPHGPSTRPVEIENPPAPRRATMR